jgi:heme/copper-type cytochrome/quinol oxidase subunit 4
MNKLEKESDGLIGISVLTIIAFLVAIIINWKVISAVVLLIIFVLALVAGLVFVCFFIGMTVRKIWNYILRVSRVRKEK